MGLEELDRDLALTIWTYRNIVSHRRISATALAKELGCSRAWVAHLLNAKPRAEILSKWMEPLDSALTRITDRRGGILVSCGCTPAAVAEVAIDIHKGNHWNER